MRYQVLDNSMPADCFNHKVDDSWEQSTFDSFDDALCYARKWAEVESPAAAMMAKTESVYGQMCLGIIVATETQSRFER